MASGLMNRIKLRVKPTFALVAGVILCIWIFLPLSTVLSAELFLLVAPMKYGPRFVVTEIATDAVAFCVSGFLTGLLVSSLARNREMRITILASLVVIAWYVIVSGSISFRAGLRGGDLACSLLGITVCAICLLAFAVIGACLIAGKRGGLRGK